MSVVGFLGPRGTFTEEALVKSCISGFEESVSYPTIPEVLHAVHNDEIDKGIVPIENMIEGSVNVTVDTLASDTELLIEKEIILPVRLNLVVKPGVDEEDISTIFSIPHAAAQCRKFLDGNFQGVGIIAANSTAEAAMKVSETDGPAAAIANETAARLFGLNIIHTDIEDFPDNKTMFVLVGKEPAQRTGEDKTSMVCFIRKNRPGSLLEILKEFASRDVNLTKIESRPTRKALGEYFFYIDVEGHAEDENLAASFKVLREELRELKLLGSYSTIDIT